MHELCQAEVKFVSKSIGLKIFSVVLLVIMVMVVVRIVNMRFENTITEAFQRVSNRYIPAYGALAEANLNSVEQALTVRGIVIANTLSVSDSIRHQRREDLLRFGIKFNEEIRIFHQMISLELQEPSELIGIETLARLDEKVAAIELKQSFFESEYQRLLEVLEKGQLDNMNDELARIELQRVDFNNTLSQTLQLMLTAMQSASDEVIRLQNRLHLISAIMVTIVALFALLMSAYIARNIAKPVRILVKGTNSIVAGQLDVSLPVTTSDEIGNLTSAFNTMTGELRKANLVRDMFGKYIDPRIVKDLIEEPGSIATKGKRQVMTVLFCDMKGFTTLSESLTPESLVKILNRYFSLMSEAVLKNEGIVDKFIGDAVMAYWGMPFNSGNKHVTLAVKAALEMRDKLSVLKEELPELMGLRHNLPEISVRFGIATGEVVVGNIGSERTKNFTVMGDIVNIASRLEGTNKIYGTQILITEPTCLLLNEHFVTREIDILSVPGKNEANKVYEVMGLRELMDSNALSLKEKFAEGLTAYRSKDWVHAKKAFNTCLQIAPDDGPALTFIKRMEHFEIHPPPQIWDGTWVITQK